jgi:hypothetical protein
VKHGSDTVNTEEYEHNAFGQVQKQTYVNPHPLASLALSNRFENLGAGGTPLVL